MRATNWSQAAVGILLTIVTAGCGSPTPAATQSAAPTASAPTGIVSASASVEPVTVSHLAFLIAAPVKDVDVRAGDQVKAGQTLVVLDTPGLQYAVTGAQAEVQSAQANALLQRMARKTWNGAKFISLSGPPELRQIADARVLQAQAALDVARANLAQGALVAPFDGTIVSIAVVPGEMAVPSQPVLILADLHELQIQTTDLSEREIAQVHVGQTATTRLKAFAQDLTGKVISIAPRSQPHNGDNVYQVTIELDQPPAGLLWGMTGDVTIQVK
jgi:RND family efflux transporter MFP subunit